jgi:hypothetical protein
MQPRPDNPMPDQAFRRTPRGLFVPFLLLGAAACPVPSHAGASLEVMQALGSGFGRFSPLTLALCGFLLVAIMGVLVAMEILRSDHRQREKVDIGWHYFGEMAAQKRLTPAETDVLKRIVEAGELGSADMVFESSFIYEDSLEPFLKANASRLEKDEHLYALLRGLRVKLGYAHLPAEIPIGSTRQLEEGMPVTILDGEGSTCRGRVAEVGERRWAVALEEDLPPTIAAGAAVDASMLRANDGEYAARLTVSGTRLGSRSVFFPHTRALERKQMRNWVRIDVNIPCRVTVIAKPPPEPVPAADHIPGPPVGMVLEGRLLDLSGGGACARFTSPIPQGHVLSLNFDLPGTSLRGVQSEVMRMQAVSRSGREDFEHNLKFITMETASQEKIVRYIFEKQRIDSHLRGPSPAVS